MYKLAKKLAQLADNLLSEGHEKEAHNMFHHALRVAHDSNPLMGVLGELGFEPSDVFEYGDDDKLDEVHPSEKSVHKNNGDQVREIWISVDPESGELEYGYMHEGGDNEHKHAYYDNLEDLIAHIVEEEGADDLEDASGDDSDDKGYAAEQDSDCGCGCGGTCGGKSAALSAMLNKYAKAKKKNVRLNKPFRTPGGPKKFSVYVKNEKGNVVKVNFGDPNMRIKKNIPARRKNFRARHHCESPGPKWKARFWSCKNW